MSYRDYLIEIKKDDFNKLKQYQEKDREMLVKEFCRYEDFNIQTLCYGPKTHIILEVGLGVDFHWKRSIPDVFPFTDFETNSFQILNKEKFKELITKYKDEYQSHLSFTLSKSKYKIDNTSINTVTKLKKELKHECDKAIRKAENELYELDCVFNIINLEKASNEFTEPLINSWSMRDTLINLFYIYRHFNWEASYLLYAGW